MFMRIFGLIAVGVAIWQIMRQKSRSKAPVAFAEDEGQTGNFAQVRNAGAASMRSDPPEWDEIDEASDASFPASDPPSH